MHFGMEEQSAALKRRFQATRRKRARTIITLGAVAVVIGCFNLGLLTLNFLNKIGVFDYEIISKWIQGAQQETKDVTTPMIEQKNDDRDANVNDNDNRDVSVNNNRDANVNDNRNANVNNKDVNSNGDVNNNGDVNENDGNYHARRWNERGEGKNDDGDANVNDNRDANVSDNSDVNDDGDVNMNDDDYHARGEGWQEVRNEEIPKHDSREEQGASSKDGVELNTWVEDAGESNDITDSPSPNERDEALDIKTPLPPESVKEENLFFL